MIDLTDVDVVSDLLKRAVAEKGADYVYPGASVAGDGENCFYFNEDSTPSCIIGHVIAYAGIKREDLVVKLDDYGYVTQDPDAEETEDCNFWNPVSELNRYGIIDASLDTLQMMRAAQNAQDTGCSWGQAIVRAGVK